jgi:phosphonate transport system substrate-binding protein
MQQSLSPYRLKPFGYLPGILVFLAFMTACTDSTGPTVVDFEKTIAASRPGEANPVQPGRPVLRVAVGAMVSPKETFVHYRQLLDYLGNRLGMDVELVQRKTYGEISELVGNGGIDLAFICSGPYATGKGKYGFELLATPEIQGSHFYQSYLIVNRDSPFGRLEDLKGRTFAFTDPDSHTGKLVPTHWLAERNERPETFFGKAIYTYSHDNSILAVAKGLVDGAAVDGLVWEFYRQKKPSLTDATRVIRKSEPFGIPPVVASGSLAPAAKLAVREILLSMHEDPVGAGILGEIMIERFVEPRDEWYDGIRHLWRGLARDVE